jgi:hypothetical protein
MRINDDYLNEEDSKYMKKYRKSKVYLECLHHCNYVMNYRLNNNIFSSKESIDKFINVKKLWKVNNVD